MGNLWTTSSQKLHVRLRISRKELPERLQLVQKFKTDMGLKKKCNKADFTIPQHTSMDVRNCLIF